MSELQSSLKKLFLRLDYVGMRVKEAVVDALRAIEQGDVEGGLQVNRRDARIDREEVEIEQECLRLLALYQPAAVDLRTILTIVKVNSDLERIADLAASIGRRVKHVVEDRVDLQLYDGFDALVRATADILDRTMLMLPGSDATAAGDVIESDNQLDRAYKRFVQSVLDTEGRRVGGAPPATTLVHLAKAMERIGDHCTNIAEDIIFLKTGDIVRHAGAFTETSP